MLAFLLFDVFLRMTVGLKLSVRSPDESLFSEQGYMLYSEKQDIRLAIG